MWKKKKEGATWVLCTWPVTVSGFLAAGTMGEMSKTTLTPFLLLKGKPAYCLIS